MSCQSEKTESAISGEAVAWAPGSVQGDSQVANVAALQAIDKKGVAWQIYDTCQIHHMSFRHHHHQCEGPLQFGSRVIE